jgi:hypothetical protein
MNKFRFTIKIMAIAIFMFAFASLAQAQASRTWVSGVGDDANPCSRTAPCKTFAGAISKTAAGGEIDCLDPGGFGAVTITKSITIDGGSQFGSILTSLGGTGVIINDTGASPPTGTVTLRHLWINGIGTAANGIRILSEKRVNIIDCQIFGMTARGISDERTHGGGPTLNVQDTTIHNVGTDGVHVGNPTTNVSAAYDNLRIISAGGVGIFMTNGSSTEAKNCNVTFATTGIQIDGSSATATIIGTSLGLNSTGLANTASANTKISECTITNNATGISIPSGSVTGYGNNVVDGNAAGNAVTTSLTQK